MVPMGRIEHHLIRLARAGKDADDILRGLTLDGVFPADRGLYSKRHGLEALLRRGGGERVEVLARRGEERLGLVELHPADRLALVHVIARRVLLELRAGPGGLDDAPGIGGREAVMHDDRGGRALAGGFLDLIGPAAIIG
ncbi:hypothetical protein QU38_01245, partial [Staphylococcus aureus]